MVKAVLFDMDGVLLDSLEAWLLLFNKARVHYGLSSVARDDFLTHAWGVSSAKVGEKYFPGIELSEIIQFYGKHYSEFLDKVSVFPETKPLLEELKKRGIKTAILTNSNRLIADQLIKHAEIRELLDIVITPDEVKNPKPDPEMIVQACERFGIELNEALFVGDTENDIMAGKNAGVKTVGVGVEGDEKVSNVGEVIAFV